MSDSRPARSVPVVTAGPQRLKGRVGRAEIRGVNLQVVYLSHATRPVSAEELDGILRVSRRNNGRVGITGALLYAGGRFLQILEGSVNAVDAVLARIERDERHRDVRYLTRGVVTGRAFPTWSMGIVTPDARVRDAAGYQFLAEPMRAFDEDSSLRSLLELFALGEANRLASEQM